MMNYEEFKKVVVDKIMSYMPKAYQKLNLSIQQVEKVNLLLEGLTFSNTENGVSPTVYLNNMYQEYLETEDMENILSHTAKDMVEAIEKTPCTKESINLTEIKDKIVFQLINTEQNKMLLMNVPHRAFHDLSIIYRIIIKNENGGVVSTVINNSLAQMNGLSEENLYSLATENYKRVTPPVIQSMDEVMKSIFLDQKMPMEMIDEILDMSDRPSLWVISNLKKLNGAASILCEECLFELANKINSDFYILPSSVHECLAAPISMGTPEELSDLVVEVNSTQVSLEERLSNNVYYYSRKERKVSLILKNQNQSIDFEKNYA